MIELRQVTLARPAAGGSRPLLEGVSVTIRRGEHVYLIGPTGIGKTTFLRALYLDAVPDRGVVQVGDYRSDTIRETEVPYLRRTLGVVFQDFQLLPDRTVFENVAFPLHVTGRTGPLVKTKALAALARVGLSHRQGAYPHELSGGEQQRVVIARAVVGDPWLLLADEPTGNLDPLVGEDILKLLLGLNAQGMTLVVATHDYRLVKKYPARTLAFLNRQLVEVDPQTL